MKARGYKDKIKKNRKQNEKSIVKQQERERKK